jgi:lipopolysaccharide biosynthesis glycosyltransferase
VLDIACASDAHYLPHCAVMVRSLLAEHPDRDVRVHVLLSADIPRSDIARLKRTCAGTRTSIVVHPVSDEALDGLPSWGRIPTTMWARILLPEMLSDIERVLYVDVDVLVVAALDELWSIDLADAYLAAVTNVPEQHRFDHATDLGLADSQT